MAKRGAENQFCVVPRKCIKLLGESVGISYLSSEVAATLAEDASYRIRQTIQSANQFVKHSKRDHITGDDMNKALSWGRVAPIYGYGSKNSNIFSSISTKDGDFFFHEDKEINLRELAFSKGFASLNDLGSSEITIEVSLLDKASASRNEGQCDSQPSTKQSDFDDLNPVLKSYYNQITRGIINADTKTVKVILDDLKTNSRIQILLPYFVNFSTTVIPTFSEDVDKLLRVFDLIKFLVDNKHLYVEPYVVQLVRAVMYCLIEKPISKISASWLDDWTLRSRAAQALCHIDRKCNNAANLLHLQLLRTFQDIYNANDRPLHSQYGAITGLAMLGDEAVEQTIFPHLKEYSDHLVNFQNNEPTSETLREVLCHILDILKASAISVFRSKLRSLVVAREKQELYEKSRGSKLPSTGTDTKSCLVEQRKWSQHVPEWYEQTYELVGDSFVLFLGNPGDYENFTQCKSRPVTQLRNSMLNQSKVQYIRKIIQNASENLQRKVPSSEIFSLEAEKKRRALNEDSRAYLSFGFLDSENSELWLENLLMNSTKEKRKFDLKDRVGKLRCFGRKRTPSRHSIALLSLPM